MILTRWNCWVGVAGTTSEMDWVKSKLTFSTGTDRFGNPQYDCLLLSSRPIFPAGWILPLVEHARRAGLTCIVRDERRKPPQPAILPRLDWLYGYQQRAFEAVVRAGGQGMIDMGVGGGKSLLIVAFPIALGGRWAVFVQEKSLVEMLCNRYNERAPAGSAPCGMIWAGRWEVGERLTVVSIQTMANEWQEDRKAWSPRAKAFFDSLQGILADECFPAGTCVGNTQIESICVGDLVPSYDTTTQTIIYRRVARIFRQVPKALVQLHLANGNTIVCTPDHPFMTPNGWQTAACLSGSSVLNTPHDNSTMPSVPNADSTSFSTGILHSMPCNTSRGASKTSGTALQCLSDTSNAERYPRLRTGSPRPSLLFRRTQTDLGHEIKNRKRIQSHNARCCQIRSPDASGQPNVGSSRQRKSQPNAPSEWKLETAIQRWEWMPGTSTPTTVSRGAGCRVDDGTHCPDEGTENQRVSKPLQDRHCKSTGSSGCRSGRLLSQFTGSTEPGPEKRRLPSWIGVDRVEVLKPGSAGGYGNLCPDGYVYNLEVEDTHTYLVGDGYVVHNCHGSGASTTIRQFRSCQNAFWRIGLSGTVTGRSDHRDHVTQGHFGPVVFKITGKELESLGKVASGQVVMRRVDQPGTPLYQEGGREAAVIKSHLRNQAVLEMVREFPKPCLVFIHETDHGERLLELIRTAGWRAEFVWGDTPTKIRTEVIRRVEIGALDVVVASNAWKQGVDIIHLRSGLNAAGGMSVILTEQRRGRPVRVCHTVGCPTCAKFGAKRSMIWGDFYDSDSAHRGREPHWLARHSEARRKAYEEKGQMVTLR